MATSSSNSSEKEGASGSPPAQVVSSSSASDQKEPGDDLPRLLGRYLPTEKNKLVEDHYAKLGFTLLERGADGSSAWVLPVADVPRVALPIAVQRVGYGSPESAAA